MQEKVQTRALAGHADESVVPREKLPVMDDLELK
jgi:hypothetical protein